MRLLPLREHKSKLDLFVEMWRDFLLEQDLVNGPKDQLLKDLSKALPEKLIDSNRELFLIEHENKPIGFGEVFLEEKCFPDLDLPEICLKVYGFFIRPEYRGSHLGHAAFKLLRQWGHEKDAAFIEVEVKKELNNSNHFFEKEGLELLNGGPRNIWRGFI
jgi:GNAT superfamily N-acetyltransferase